MDVKHIKSVWRSADCICLDVDSTVVVDEGIDELARFLGRYDKVAALTTSAMQGGMSYRESLAARLSIIRPSRKDVDSFIDKHPPRLTEGVENLVKKLLQNGVLVCLVSGGFDSIVGAVADRLGISRENVFANELLFHSDGSYAGFKKERPTSDNNGKAKVVEYLKEKRGCRSVVHVGDGMTDAEACPPADAFIGFGGNQRREDVVKSAGWFVMSFKELLDELD